MSDPRDSLPAVGPARTERDQSTQPPPGLVGSQVETPAPDRLQLRDPVHLPETLSPTSAPTARSPARKPPPAGPDQASPQPHDETHASGQPEVISSSDAGHRSEDTVTRLPTSGAPAAQDNQPRPTPSPAPSTSKQLSNTPFSSSIDEHAASNSEVNTAPLSSNPAEIRRNSPLPPLPRGFDPGMPPSVNYTWINPAYNRRLNNIGGATRPSNHDRNSGMPSVTSQNNVIPVSPPRSPGVTSVPLSSGHGNEKSGYDLEDLPPPGPDQVPNQGYPTVDRSRSRTLRSRDWLGDAEEKERSVGKRLDPTLIKARLERDKLAVKAKVTAWALNVAIGFQVLIGALTTGLSAAAPGTSSIAVSVLGGIATLLASFLAKARGSAEPELSTGKVKDLDQFIRDCETFLLDHGHVVGSTKPEYEDRLHELRERFETLLGPGKGERRPSQALGP